MRSPSRFVVVLTLALLPLSPGPGLALTRGENDVCIATTIFPSGDN